MKKGWEYKRLPEMSENLDSLRKPVTKKNRTAGIYPYYGASGIVDYVDDYLFDEDLLCISEDGANLLMRTYPIAFPISGKVWVNNHAHVLRFKDMATQKYVEYFFAGFKLDEYITGAAQPKLTQKALNNITIKIPISLSEQQRIVDYLDAAFAKIDAMKANAEKSINEAKALFQASLKEMLEPKEGWEEKNLNDIAEYSIGLTYKPTDVCKDGTIVLRSSNIQDGKLDLNDIVRVNANIKDKLYVRCGDILMCSRNGSARLVGKVCMIPELKERMTYGTFMMVIRSVYNPLLYHYFDTGLFRSQIKHGEANMINQITRYMLDEVKLNLPPITEQQTIVATLDSLKSKVDRLQANFEKISQECDALKQAILRQIFE